MCKICQKKHCPPNCPAFSPNKEQNSELYCASCGEVLTNGEGFYRKSGFPYCETCLDFADSETLVRICELNKREWLTQMGFTHETAEATRI